MATDPPRIREAEAQSDRATRITVLIVVVAVIVVEQLTWAKLLNWSIILKSGIIIIITMKSRINSGLYHMKTRDFDYEIVHLYEHMLIQTFINSLSEHDISRFFFGWISGETFRDFMFVNYNFYSPVAETLFHQFIAKNGRIDFSLIDNELLRIQAEDLSVINKIDSDKLIAELKRIDETSFHNHSGEITSEYVKSNEKTSSQIIKLRQSKSKFSQVAIICKASRLDLDEKIAFQRLTPILYEMVDIVLFEIGSYQNNVGFPIDKGGSDGLTAVAIHTIRRSSYTMQQMDEILRQSIERLIHEISEYPEQLKLYIDCFKNSTEWSDAPQNFYRSSGLLTSRNNIAIAFTERNILSILSKIDIKCKIATKDNWLMI